MFSDRLRDSGWQGGSLVAITYVYFLIFAQFAFLKRLAALGIADSHLQGVMGAMAVGGIAVSLAAPRVRVFAGPLLRIRAGLLICGASALLATLPLAFISAAADSLLIGAGLGLLTVTLVSHLRKLTGLGNSLLTVAAGTGVGYFLCNIPSFFNSSPQSQSLVAALLCMIGTAITFVPLPRSVDSIANRSRGTLPFGLALCGFTALVWLDSAAFFIIQNTPALKSGTWQGTAHLSTNGAIHFAAALCGARLLQRKGLMATLAAAFLLLGGACLLLHNAQQIALASLLYPAGVSIYSVALVAYPALLAAVANDAERGRIAGWIYAVAGWAGSAMGIGMGQHLGYVPTAFVAAAGTAVLLPFFLILVRVRTREVLISAVVLLAAFALDRLAPGAEGSASTRIERGREVYLSEGCIHCHSQYVRPNSSDVLMWGPASSISEVRMQNPPLIGNRRQGPDLSRVGARRSALWLKAHFYNPAEVSGASIMPEYGFLFRDQRGDDLVAYLQSLNAGDAAGQRALESMWQPSADAIATADPKRGEALYEQDCANCHDANGDTRRTWTREFSRVPTDPARGPFQHLPPGETAQERFIDIAHITRFGIPGTDMPGHEYLSDRDIASLSLWVEQSIEKASQ
jgi:cbb3-type cytochrome c oxidase subunit II